jgi:hypothetical protein
MSVQPSSQTLLLYCPYDRRVTRHVRRGPNLDLNCAECGRRVEGSASADAAGAQDSIHLQRTAAITQLPARPRTMARPMGTPIYRSRSRIAWLPYIFVLVVVGAGVFAAMKFANNPAAPPRAGTSVAAAPSAQQAVDAPGASAPAPAVGTVRVANTDGVGAYVRRSPSLADRLRPWPDNTLLKIVGPDTTAEGIDWKQVEDPAGNRGWIPSQYTRPEANS